MAKIRLHDAARNMSVHPLNLLLRLYPLVGGLDDCWPDVDGGYIETLRFGEGRIESHRGGGERPAETRGGREPQDHAIASVSVGRVAGRIVEKLWRKDRWGKMAVSLPSLRHMCGGMEKLEEGISELVSIGILVVEGKSKAVSLNPARKQDVESIARSSIEARR